jgi:hypothetical protein
MDEGGLVVGGLGGELGELAGQQLGERGEDRLHRAASAVSPSWTSSTRKSAPARIMVSSAQTPSVVSQP